MKMSRDRIAATAAVVAVVALAALIVTAVRDADRNGRAALEDLQRAQISQLTKSMDARLTAAFGSLGGVVAQPWELEPGSAADQAILERFLLDPDARTGALLIADDRTVLGGVKLETINPSERLDRPGLDDAMRAATPAILPVAEGSTAALPTLAFVIPVQSAAGARGAIVFEIEVSTDSSFNVEVAELGRGETGEFLFVDALGTIVASSNPQQLGQQLTDRSVLDLPAGSLRRADGKITAVGDVPSAGWRAVFEQDTSEFDGALRGPLRNAVLLVALAVVVAGGVTFTAVLRRLRRARDEHRRLEELHRIQEEFISIVSHELRTPVTGVAGFLQTTLDHWDEMDDQDRRIAVGRAAANARRLQALTSDVLDTARFDRGEFQYAFETIDLRGELREAVVGITDAHPGRTVTVDDPKGRVWVHADAGRLQQVLVNLLDNAIKSSPADAPVELHLETTGQEAVVSVVDHGMGVHEAQLDRLFEKFTRGGSAVQGTGLGLYVARQIVDAHGGRIWVENAPGTGATFRVALPLAPAPSTSVGA